jgi:integrase
MRPTTALASVTDEYLAHLTARHVAPDTVRNRGITLQQLIEITGNVRLDAINAVHIDQWRAAHPWQPSTANRKIGELRAFFTWARARGHLTTHLDPTVGRRSERVPVRNRQRIPFEEWPRLLDAAPHPLERALVACGLYLMARSSELQTIQLRHVDLDAGTIEVYRHKVQRPDTLPICAELDAELRRWLTWYSARVPLTPDMYLLPNRSPHQTLRDARTGRLARLDPAAALDPLKPLSRPHRKVQMVLTRAGFTTEHEGGHTLRRSAARAYYDELCADGYDGALRRVQSMLDHSNTSVTEGYLGLALDKEARNKALKGQPMFRRHATAATVASLEVHRARSGG